MRSWYVYLSVCAKQASRNESGSELPRSKYCIQALWDFSLEASVHAAQITFCIMISCFACARDVQERDARPPTPGYIITVERMGGYLGVYEKIWIYADGEAVNDAGKKAKVPAGDVVEWQKNISLLASLRPTYALQLPSLCMDCLVYRITLYQKDGTRNFVRWDSLEGETDDDAAGLRRMRDKLLKLRWK